MKTLESLTEFKKELSKDINCSFNSHSDNSRNNNLFILKPTNSWIEEAKNTSIPNKLFGEFWFEGELCILFADTNLGKSVLAVQIADSISTGKGILGFNFDGEPQKLIYIDFELSNKQIENRYSDHYSNHYVFNDNFLRAEIGHNEINPSSFSSFDNYLFTSIEDLVKTNNSKVIIIDNLTYLKSGTEKSNEAISLMHYLVMLKRKYNLSILVLAHTPKRDGYKPVTKNDLSGSKMLMNFCDSCFAIGQSFSGDNLRYLKQIKQRYVENLYGTENIIVCTLKKDINFLKFEFFDFDQEINHLKEKTKLEIDDRNEQIVALKNDGKTNVEIADIFGLTEGAIRNIIKKNTAH